MLCKNICLGQLLLISSLLNSAVTYKPVIIIHGLFDSAFSMEYMANYIKKAHPGTTIEVINIYKDIMSLVPLWRQIRTFNKTFSQLMEKYPEGVNLIGYSQGGLVSRGLIQTLDNHTVNTFVSLSSPQMGQYGSTVLLSHFFPWLLKENAYRFFYTYPGQWVSIGNFWKDPHHQYKYFKWNTFLPKLNNEIKHSQRARFRKNLLRLKKMVLIGGPDDGIIAPWQSSQFGFYDGNETVVPMERQKIYLTDALGMRTLDKRNSLVKHTLEKINHFQWHDNSTVLECCILPYLN